MNGSAHVEDDAPSPSVAAAAEDSHPQPVTLVPVMDEQPGVQSPGDAQPAMQDFVHLPDQPMAAAAPAEESSSFSVEPDVEVIEDTTDPDEDHTELQQAAMISEPSTPRRGWWNRFVRKSD
jgi:hypothetical protein